MSRTTSRTSAGKSTSAFVVISPATTTMPVVVSVSQATRELRILREHRVEHGVRDLVAHLVGVAHRDRLGREQLARHAELLGSGSDGGSERIAGDPARPRKERHSSADAARPFRTAHRAPTGSGARGSSSRRPSASTASAASAPSARIAQRASRAPAASESSERMLRPSTQSSSPSRARPRSARAKRFASITNMPAGRACRPSSACTVKTRSQRASPLIAPRPAGARSPPRCCAARSS